MTLIPKITTHQQTIKPQLCMDSFNCIETANYLCAGYSIPKYDKERNGDDQRIIRLEQEELCIAVISDGVSQQPCDWLASELVCTGFIQAFTANQEMTMEDRINNSLEKANMLLLEHEAPCKKMAATLSACIIDEKTNQLYWLNIGDSRIYSVFNNRLSQLTTDDVKLYSQSIQTSIGKKNIEQSQLTKCMGKSNLNPCIQQKEIKEGELILLASDGFYNARKASFQKKLIDFSQQEEFKIAFGNLASAFEIMRDDDLTVVAIKRKNA